MQLWAGHRDSPLTNRGLAQATALGQALAHQKLDMIYCSDLKRAQWTANEVYKAQLETGPATERADSGSSTAAPRVVVSLDSDEEEEEQEQADARPNKKVKISSSSKSSDSSERGRLPQPVEDEIFREQYFGALEGATWTDARASTGSREVSSKARHTSQEGVWRRCRTDGGLFMFGFKAGLDRGESSADVARRARTAVDRYIKPWILLAHHSKQPRHIVIVAHGIVGPCDASAFGSGSCLQLMF